MYVDGVSEGTWNDTTNYIGTTATIGGRFAALSGDQRSLNGHIQDLRITKGVARYTADFTPPLQLYNTYSVSGTITDDTGTPCARTVRLYDRATGAFIAETTSDASTGAYDFSGIFTSVMVGEDVQRIVLDDSAGTLYNDLIDRVIPG